MRQWIGTHRNNGDESVVGTGHRVSCDSWRERTMPIENTIATGCAVTTKNSLPADPESSRLATFSQSFQQLPFFSILPPHFATPSVRDSIRGFMSHMIMMTLTLRTPELWRYFWKYLTHIPKQIAQKIVPSLNYKWYFVTIPDESRGPRMMPWWLLMEIILLITIC